jgi:hypothetical protein
MQETFMKQAASRGSSTFNLLLAGLFIFNGFYGLISHKIKFVIISFVAV